MAHRRSIVLIASVLALLTTSAVASTIIEVTMWIMLEGNSGYVVDITEDQVLQGQYFLFVEDGYVRVYAEKDILAGETQWYVYPEVCRIVKSPDLGPGDSWLSVPHEDLGSMSSQVEALQTVTVPAGTFPAVKVASYPTGSPSSVDSYSWWVSGVGRVIERETSVAGALVLQSYRVVGGSGYLPLALTNRWVYEFGDPLAHEATSWGAVKAMFR